MATKQNNNLLIEEIKLKNQLKKAEADIAAAKDKGLKDDDEKLKKLEKELTLKKDILDKFKLKNSEALIGINLAKKLANQAGKHTNILFRQKTRTLVEINSTNNIQQLFSSTSC